MTDEGMVPIHDSLQFCKIYAIFMHNYFFPHLTFDIFVAGLSNTTARIFFYEGV